MIRQTLTTGAPPSELLEALRTRAGQWRPSELPDHLQNAGVTSIECRVRDNRFRLWYTWGWRLRNPVTMMQHAPAIGLRVWGTVTPTDTGGSAMTLVVGCRPPWSVMWPLLLASGLALLALVSDTASWPFAAAVAAGAGFSWWRFWSADRELTRSGAPMATYLAERAEAVLADHTAGTCKNSALPRNW